MKKPNFNLPKGVVLIKNYLYYRPYIRQSQRINIEVDSSGRLNPPIKLGNVSDSERSIYSAYLAATEQLSYQNNVKYMTLFWLHEEYLQSRMYMQLTANTKRRYKDCQRILQHPLKINGKESVLGNLNVKDLYPATIRRLLDKRLSQYQADGKKGTSQCNNEKALLSAMYKYGVQYIDDMSQIPNPFREIQKFNVDIRERYVTDAEYKTQYDFAKSHMPNYIYIPIVMELTYLLAARGIEVTELTIDAIRPEGIIVDRKKGSKTTLVRWTPRLTAAVEQALALHKTAQAPTASLLTPARGGTRLTKSALDSAWQKLKIAMQKAGLGDVYFMLHDLKRKGISDSKDDRIAGHVSDSIRANYNVKIQQYDPPS